MKNKVTKTMIAGILAGGVFTASFSNTSAATFTDVSDRYIEAVTYLHNNHIVSGLSETKFGVQEPIKRVDSAIMIAKIRNLIPEQAAKTSKFTDVPTRGIPAVEVLRSLGIINGKTTSLFGANDTLTRGEAALILVNAYDLSPVNESTTKFSDVSPRYLSAVNTLVANGISNGKTKTKFGTADQLTRGELAIMLYNLEKLKREDGGNSNTPDDQAPEVEDIIVN
ncbi:S-layer homology domain-containing protein [Pseudobacillus sp. 179-B 2D1 NHS]|uniref:S-layer homology domain-containing protein n=1 Tax=Pseudobacillus sp. 179-B 2D1 NHS TaxID=3374292 RepID=UPI00387A7FC5